jgi:hypothetical protein
MAEMAEDFVTEHENTKSVVKSFLNILQNLKMSHPGFYLSRVDGSGRLLSD